MSTIILAIESSCDETAASIVKDGRDVKSNIIYSQIELHKLYGGVVPEIASRKHVEKINQVVQTAISEAGVTWDDIDAVAVTYGPGLVGALLVGVSFAKSLAYAKNKPLVGVNHIEGHIAANYIENTDLKPPFMCMVASGGHSHLVYVKDYTEFEIVGRTRDDAAGEAFDKVARAIGLGYPGGPKIDKLAREGNPDAVHFPRAKVGDSAKEYGCEYLALAGGVASNSMLRACMENVCNKENVKFVYPSPVFCTDNAAMIGVAGFHDFINGKRSGWDLNAVPNLKIGETGY